ncbi:MAG: hypothetical protein LPK02_07680 [Rhodobacterales bacterium]|nr:hypothetical protein [Rhodobacterales bacterium]
MARVRLTNPAMASFSSYMGVTKFEDGVSVGDVSEREIRILGSITGIEIVEEDGSTRPGGPSNDMIAQRSTPAAVETKLTPVGEPNSPVEITPGPAVFEAPKTEAETEAEKTAQALEAEVAAMEEAAADAEAAQPAVVYTREELEAIADDKGITGLREIGDALDAKSNSIEGLIEKILAAQKV